MRLIIMLQYVLIYALENLRFYLNIHIMFLNLLTIETQIFI